MEGFLTLFCDSPEGCFRQYPSSWPGSLPPQQAGLMVWEVLPERHKSQRETKPGVCFVLSGWEGTFVPLNKLCWYFLTFTMSW